MVCRDDGSEKKACWCSKAHVEPQAFDGLGEMAWILCRLPRDGLTTTKVRRCNIQNAAPHVIHGVGEMERGVHSNTQCSTSSGSTFCHRTSSAINTIVLATCESIDTSNSKEFRILHCITRTGEQSETRMLLSLYQRSCILRWL